MTIEQLIAKYEELEARFRKDRERLAETKDHDDDEYLRAYAVHILAEDFLADLRNMKG